MAVGTGKHNKKCLQFLKCWKIEIFYFIYVLFMLYMLYYVLITVMSLLHNSLWEQAVIQRAVSRLVYFFCNVSTTFSWRNVHWYIHQEQMRTLESDTVLLRNKVVMTYFCSLWETYLYPWVTPTSWHTFVSSFRFLIAQLLH